MVLHQGSTIAIRRGGGLHAYRVLILAVLAGCASVETPGPRIEPDTRFTGIMAPGDVRGERSAQVLGAIEAQLLQSFPQVRWQATRPDQADVVLDVTVYAANISDTRSSQEQRLCRRWAEPDKNAKDSLRRMLSANCVDWQVRQIPCLARKYEIDVQVRARQPGSSRVVASDRRVVVRTQRNCGEEAPAQAALQAQAEREVAAWTMGLLGPSLATLAASRTPEPAVASEPPAMGASSQDK